MRSLPCSESVLCPPLVRGGGRRNDRPPSLQEPLRCLIVESSCIIFGFKLSLTHTHQLLAPGFGLRNALVCWFMNLSRSAPESQNLAGKGGWMMEDCNLLVWWRPGMKGPLFVWASVTQGAHAVQSKTHWDRCTKSLIVTTALINCKII